MFQQKRVQDPYGGTKMVMTNHFIERYYLRVFDQKELPHNNYDLLERVIEKDMGDRITDRQKGNMLFLSSLPVSLVPFGNRHSLVIKNNKLVTITYVDKKEYLKKEKNN